MFWFFSFIAIACSIVQELLTTSPLCICYLFLLFIFMGLRLSCYSLIYILDTSKCFWGSHHVSQFLIICRWETGDFLTHCHCSLLNFMLLIGSCFAVLFLLLVKQPAILWISLRWIMNPMGRYIFWIIYLKSNYAEGYIYIYIFGCCGLLTLFSMSCC